MNFNLLKKSVQTSWSQIKLSVKVTVIFYLKFNIILIHFFIETKIGYSFYLFCLLYGFFGCSNTQNSSCYITDVLATLLVLYVMSTIVELWFLVKIPFTRKILDNLLTKEYVFKNLNDHILSQMTFKTFGIFIATVCIDSATAQVEQIQNKSNAREIMNEYYKSLEKAELKPDLNLKLYNDARNEAYFNLNKTPEGLISKSISNDTTKYAWLWLSKVIGDFNKN